jgi:hypothetical protein
LHQTMSNSSQQSIQKVVAFALKYFSRCGEDLWECIVEECQKVSLILRTILFVAAPHFFRFLPWRFGVLFLAYASLLVDLVMRRYLTTKHRVPSITA